MGTEFMKHKVATGVIWLVDRFTGEGIIRATALVAGCSGVTTLAYLISFWIGLSTISALIASHANLSETRSLLNNRILGTVIGIAMGIATSTSLFGATVSTQIALGVALCAIARESGHHCRSAWSSSTASSVEPPARFRVQHFDPATLTTPQKVPEADGASMTQRSVIEFTSSIFVAL